MVCTSNARLIVIRNRHKKALLTAKDILIKHSANDKQTIPEIF